MDFWCHFAQNWGSQLFMKTINAISMSINLFFTTVVHTQFIKNVPEILLDNIFTAMLWMRQIFNWCLVYNIEVRILEVKVPEMETPEIHYKTKTEKSEFHFFEKKNLLISLIIVFNMFSWMECQTWLLRNSILRSPVLMLRHFWWNLGFAFRLWAHITFPLVSVLVQ